MKRLWAPLAILMTMSGLGATALVWSGGQRKDEPQTESLPAQRAEAPSLIVEGGAAPGENSPRPLPPPETVVRGNDGEVIRQPATAAPPNASGVPQTSAADPFGARRAASPAAAEPRRAVSLAGYQDEQAPGQPPQQPPMQPSGDASPSSRYAPRVLPLDDSGEPSAPPPARQAAMVNELRSRYGDALNDSSPPASQGYGGARIDESAAPNEDADPQHPPAERGELPAQAGAPSYQGLADQSPPPARYSVDAEASTAVEVEPPPTVISAPRALVETDIEPAAMPTQPSSLVAAVPGAKRLEGQQTPALVIEKTAPPEIQIGRPAVFLIKVRNVGQATANDVTVIDRTPQGTRLVEASPQPQIFADGALVWRWSSMAPGEEQIIHLTLSPEEEGEVGSVATVSFEAQASVRSLCTRPLLTLEQTATARTLIGQNVIVNIKLTNPGTGAAANVVLEENVPDGLVHAAGSELEYEVGTLKPGESRELQLTLRAAKPGTYQNALLVRADGVAPVEHQAPVEVVAPSMELAIAGPTKRYLQREATYTLSMANPGTATAENLRMVTRLPKGLKFVSTNNAGRYDAAAHTVSWNLEELPAGEAGEVEVTLMPIETGEQKLRLEGSGDLGISHVAEKLVSVEALAELAFSVIDSADPIEVGKQTIYQIKVVNNGSKAATGILVTAELPGDLKPLGGDGAAQASVRGQMVVFEPLSRLNPREEVTFRVQAQGVRSGDHRVRVSLASAESPTPVVKEESTRVYSDE